MQGWNNLPAQQLSHDKKSCLARKVKLSDLNFYENYIYFTSLFYGGYGADLGIVFYFNFCKILTEWVNVTIVQNKIFQSNLTTCLNT